MSQQYKDRLRRLLWAEQLKEMQSLTPSTEEDYKRQCDLPLARVKRIMKSDDDVHFIGADTPLVLGKACELFIMELTLNAHLTDTTRGSAVF